MTCSKEQVMHRMKMKTMVLTGMTVDVTSTDVQVFYINEEDFEKLKKIGSYDEHKGAEWVIYAGVTFFKG